MCLPELVGHTAVTNGGAVLKVVAQLCQAAAGELQHQQVRLGAAWQGGRAQNHRIKAGQGPGHLHTKAFGRGRLADKQAVFHPGFQGVGRTFQVKNMHLLKVHAPSVHHRRVQIQFY